MYKLDMDLSNPYSIYIEDGLLDKIDEYVKNIYSGKNIYIVTDKRVGAIYLERVKKNLHSFNCKEVVIEGYESSKTLDGYKEVLEGLFNLEMVRGELLIALGGGVIGDLVGFVASTIYRGVPYVQIPTSLLAQVDSSIGGKTAIDFMGHKNSVGCFKQPSLVLIDPLTLETLPAREVKNGLGEAIKHAFIGSKKLYQMLLDHSPINEEFIYENLVVKRRHVIQDEYDTSERMKLNFGHTFGHAFELKEVGYLHGEAVLEGMLMATNLAIDLGVSSNEILDSLIKIYNNYEIKYGNFDYKKYLNDIHFDKKNIKGTINFIFVSEIGSSFIYKLSEGKLHESIN